MVLRRQVTWILFAVMVSLSIYLKGITFCKQQATHRNYPKLKLTLIKQKHFLWLTNWPLRRGSSSSGSPPISQDHRAKDRHSEHSNKQRLPSFPGKACLLLRNCHRRCCRSPPLLLLLSWKAQPVEASLLRLGWRPTSTGILPRPLAVQGALLFLFITTNWKPSTHLSKLCPQSTWTPDLSPQPPPPRVHSE